jgi:hypothetical protein
MDRLNVLACALALVSVVVVALLTTLLPLLIGG